MIPTPPHIIEQPSGPYKAPRWVSESHTAEYANLALQKTYGRDSEISLQREILNPQHGSSDRDDERNIMAAADPEIRRMEDRINSVDRESQLRLERAMAEVNGSLSVILERTDGLKSSIDSLGSLKPTIIVTAIATVLTIVGVIFAGQALWGAGFSSGQADRPPAASAAK